LCAAVTLKAMLTERKLLVVPLMPDRSKGRVQTKCSSCSFCLGVECGVKYITPGKMLPLRNDGRGQDSRKFVAAGDLEATSLEIEKRPAELEGHARHRSSRKPGTEHPAKCDGVRVLDSHFQAVVVYSGLSVRKKNRHPMQCATLNDRQRHRHRRQQTGGDQPVSLQNRDTEEQRVSTRMCSFFRSDEPPGPC
jgi:hypothetical protein